MEGVGARLGRSSSRYGTTTVFNGPVRKWKKDWVPITPSSSSFSSNNSHHHHHHNNNHHHHHSSSNSSVNGGTNGSSVSHLRLYKWAPVNKDNSNSNENNNTSSSNIKISSNNNKNNNNNNNNIGSDIVVNGSKDSAIDDVVSEEPPRRKYKYIPIAVLEEQKKELEENFDDNEAKPVDSDENAGEQASQSDGNGSDEKPDINDVPMEENQDVEENQTAPTRQDLNELDLSLGLTSHDEEQDSDSKTDPKTDFQLERANSRA